MAKNCAAETEIQSPKIEQVTLPTTCTCASRRSLSLFTGTATWAVRAHHLWQKVASTPEQSIAKPRADPPTLCTRGLWEQNLLEPRLPSPWGASLHPFVRLGVGLWRLWNLKLLPSPGLWRPKGWTENTCNDLALWADHELISNRLSLPS